MQMKDALGTVVTDSPHPCLLSQYVKVGMRTMRMQDQGHGRMREVGVGIHCVCHVACVYLGYLLYSWDAEKSVGLHQGLPTAPPPS